MKVRVVDYVSQVELTAGQYSVLPERGEIVRVHGETVEGEAEFAVVRRVWNLAPHGEMWVDIFVDLVESRG